MKWLGLGVIAAVAVVFGVLWFQATTNLDTSKSELTAAQAQLGTANSQLDTVKSQLVSTQQELASARAQLGSAQQRVQELTAGPNPQVTSQDAYWEHTGGFLGFGGHDELVITARVVNRGAAGMVRVSATDTWAGGSKTGSTEAYFAAGEEKVLSVNLGEVPGGSYSVSAMPK